MITENEILVEKVVEHEDGSATYTFEMSHKATKAIAQYGLELILLCAAYGINMNDAFDIIRAAGGGDQRMSDYRIEAATKEEWAIRALNAEERNKELTLQLLAVHGQAADVLDKLAKAVEALTVVVPTEAQICSACPSYDHSFGLMDGPQRVAMMHEAREWLHAWRKEDRAALVELERK